jgi:hypothetical protein
VSPRFLYPFHQFAGRLLEVINRLVGRNFRLIKFARGSRILGLDAYEGVLAFTDFVTGHSELLWVNKRKRARAETVPLPVWPSRKKLGDAGIERRRLGCQGCVSSARAISDAALPAHAGELELANAMGLQPMGPPDALNRGNADAGHPRHGCACPMRGLARRRFQRQGDDACGDRGVELGDARGARLIAQKAFEAFG